MNAPGTPAAVATAIKRAYEDIALDKIEMSQTPMQKLRRERFNKEAMKELADSIKADGVLQPILVRRKGAKFELVAGERRCLASKLAGVTVIPAVIRELTDLQVVSMQVVENNQREDLHPLIEAEGFEELMKTHKLTADDIAAKIGKSRSHVYGVLKYCDLVPEVRRAFFDGKVSPSIALDLARVSHAEHQKEAMREIIDDGMTYREAHRFIVETYMLRLKDAPFDINDAKLVPAAGSCQVCPKRSGNQGDLFGDIKSADICTFGKCFNAKREAHFAGERKLLEARGLKVISGVDAKKLLPHWERDSDVVAGGYLKLDEGTYVGGRYRKVSEVLGPEFKPTLIQHPATGAIIKVASKQAVATASGKPSSGTSSSSSESGYRAPKKPTGPDIDHVEMERLVALIHKNAPKTLGKPFMHAFAKEIVGSYGPVRNGHDAIAKAWGWKGKPFGGGYYGRSLPKEAQKLNDRDLILFLMEVIFVSQYQRDSWLRLFGIKGKEVREQIIEERRKAAKIEREKARAAKLLKQAKKAPAKGRTIASADFMKPMIASANLQKIIGETPMVRTEITKKLWGYIKRHGLQDKKNKRMINADDKLRPIFAGKAQVSMFDMTTMISKHLQPAPKTNKK